MTLKPCADCGREVSPRAERCPNCGLKNPARPRGEDDRANLLVDLSKLRGTMIRCRDCGVQMRARLPSCPSCGRPNPAASERRWLGPAALVIASIVFAAVAWQLDLIPRAVGKTLPSVSEFTDRDRAQSYRAGGRGRFRGKEPPRVISNAFHADCSKPASVYVYDPSKPSVSEASKPSEFLILLVGTVRNPAAVADSLGQLYGAGTETYHPGRRGFVATLSHDAVSGLRCEPAVGSIEEYPAAR